MGDLEAPTFLRVNTETMEVTLLAPDSRKGEVTVIGEVKRGDQRWVITGVEDGRAWSMVISDDGYMTLSVTGDGATWSVFGNACWRRNEAADCETAECGWRQKDCGMRIF